jgi:tRNA(fMet)-specific endonuclease VapC
VSTLYLLDTNMVSYILKGKSPAARLRLTNLTPPNIAAISTITEAELLYGLEKIGAAAQRRTNFDWFLTRLKVLSWDRDAARAYGTLRARQEAAGLPLGPLDMQIAAHAVALGAILVTNDRAFLQIPNLPGLENWATDL